MKKISIRLAERTYDILVGEKIAFDPKLWDPKKLDARRAFVFADDRLASFCKRFAETLKTAGWETSVIPVKASERLKDFSTLYPLYGRLLQLRADRRSMIFALGGGTVGDAIGFLAGTYHRGVRWVGLPTTLLAQVDSAIGGKTGVNHSLGKNLIGVFHQPSLVVCDTQFLETLSRRDRISGLGEMVKYALIYDPQLWKFFQSHWTEILELKNPGTSRAIADCARWKAKVVSKDERDSSGLREVLNFGHTFGHALEELTGYGRFRHGEAVLWGMRAATALSAIRGRLSESKAASIEAFLGKFEIPAIPRGITARRLLEALRFDKKSRGGKVRFVLLKDIGKTVLDPEVQDPEVLRSLEKIGIPR